MNQTSYSPDKFGTYLSHPGSQGCDIVRISPENFERNMFRIIQKKTGNKAMKTFERYITFDED